MPNLVLDRAAGEKIEIGDDVVITVVQTGLHRVRIAIEAPASVRILRPEAKKRERKNERC